MTPHPSPIAVSSEIQALFDALLAVLGADYMSTNAYASHDGVGTNLSVTVEDAARNRWTYSEYQVATRVTLTPAGASLGPGETIQFTAAATDGTGAPVVGAAFTYAIQPGGTGAIDASGLYTAPAAISAASADIIRCQVVGEQSWVNATVNLHP
jgi:hypothetical protein